MLRKIIGSSAVIFMVITMGQIVFADSGQLYLEAQKREAKAELEMQIVPYGEDGYISSLSISSRSTQTGASRDYNKSKMRVIFSQFGSGMQYDIDSMDGQYKCYLKTSLWDWNPLVFNALSVREDYFIKTQSSKTIEMGTHGSGKRYYSFATKGQAFEANRVELLSYD